MSVKVIIKRSINEEMSEFLASLLEELRTNAIRQPGYISGETLKCVDGPAEIMVISTWNSIVDWKRWFSTRERTDIQSKIDTLIGKETQYQIYTKE